MKHLLAAAAALSMLSVPALAAPCRDGKGKFVKCPKPAGGAIKCKDANPDTGRPYKNDGSDE